MINFHDLMSEGLERLLKTGETPEEISQMLINRSWNDIDEDNRVFLARNGLTRLIAAALDRHRRTPVSAPPSYTPPPEQTQRQREEREQLEKEERKQKEDAYQKYRKEVEQIHDFIECPSKSHTHFAKKSHCVRFIMECSDPKERKKRMIERRSRERRYNKEAQQHHNDFLDNLHAAIDWAAEQKAKQILQGIVLEASDGTMKPIWDFTTADITTWKNKSGINKDTWQDRLNWFTEAERIMKEKKIKCMNNLPDKDINALAVGAEMIWKVKT